MLNIFSGMISTATRQSHWAPPEYWRSLDRGPVSESRARRADHLSRREALNRSGLK